MNNWESTFDNEELVDLVIAAASSGLRKPALIEIFETRCSLWATPIQRSSSGVVSNKVHVGLSSTPKHPAHKETEVKT
jgi:hypothetical protein